MHDQYKINNSGFIITQSLPNWMWFTVVIFFFLLLLYVLFFLSFAGHRKVEGYSIPKHGIVKISAASGGIIVERFVNPGVKVYTGDKLVKIEKNSVSLSPTKAVNELRLQRISSEIKELNNSKFREEHRIQLLLQQLELSKQHKKSLKESLSKQKDFKLSALRSKREVLDIFSRGQMLQSVSMYSVEQFKQDLLLEEEKYEQLLASIEVNEFELQSLEIDISLKKIESESRLYQIQSSLLRLRKEEDEVLADVEYFIRSPINGYVENTFFSVGDSVKNNEHLMMLIPSKKMAYEVELLVPSSAISMVNVGQEVRLEFDAFPEQIFGRMKGTILYIDEMYLLPNDIVTPFPIDVPFFRARVELDSQQLELDDRRYDIRAGMRVAAEIELERKVVWRWLVDRFIF